jgi:hypothetical protein
MINNLRKICGGRERSPKVLEESAQFNVVVVGGPRKYPFHEQ